MWPEVVRRDGNIVLRVPGLDYNGNYNIDEFTFFLDWGIITCTYDGLLKNYFSQAYYVLGIFQDIFINSQIRSEHGKYEKFEDALDGETKTYGK